MARADQGSIHPVEELRRRCKVSEADHAGACIKMGWKPRKEVTQKEYTAAVEAFRRCAVGRR